MNKRLQLPHYSCLVGVHTPTTPYTHHFIGKEKKKEENELYERY